MLSLYNKNLLGMVQNTGVNVKLNQDKHTRCIPLSARYGEGKMSADHALILKSWEAIYVNTSGLMHDNILSDIHIHIPKILSRVRSAGSMMLS